MVLMRYPGVLEGNQNIHHLSFLAINREITISILKVMANVQGRAASNLGLYIICCNSLILILGWW